MKEIDRLVNHLNKRLEEKYPLEISPVEQQDSINIWRGKRILSTDQWLKMTASLENDQLVFDLSKGFDFFPDSLSEVIFQYNSEGANDYFKEISKEEFDIWFNDYLDLLTFKKDPDLGHAMCRNCLLDATKDRSGFRIGIHKMVTKVLKDILEINHTKSDKLTHTNHPMKDTLESVPIYPCNVRNYFSCPYEYKDNNKKFEHKFDSDIEYLFELEQITRLVDISLLKASALTQSNETLYEIDIESNTMKEIQALNNGKQVVVMKWSPIQKGKDRILEKSIISVRNKEDVLEILKDRGELDKILKQGLSGEDYDVWRVKILNLFEEIKSDLDSEFRFKYDVYENELKHTCSQCGEFANVHRYEESDTWYCLKHISACDSACET